MQIILESFLAILFDAILIWLISRLSENPPNIIKSTIGSFIISLLFFSGISYIPYMAPMVVFLFISEFRGMGALFATIIYGNLRGFLFPFLVYFLFT